MERVVKRYLMHNQGDSDDSKNEFDELKQDLTSIRYQMINDMKKSREDTIRNMFIINRGINFVADELINKNQNLIKVNEASLQRYKELQIAHNLLFNSMSFSTNEKGDEQNTKETSRAGSLTKYDYFKFAQNLVKIERSFPHEDAKHEQNMSDEKNTAAFYNDRKSSNLSVESTELVSDSEENSRKSVDELQTRLAYDFHVVYEED
jgi:hypothetical protein